MGSIIAIPFTYLERNGYVLPPQRVIEALFKKIRGVGIDLYQIIAYTEDTTELMQGRISTHRINLEDNQKSLVCKRLLTQKMDESARIAKSCGQPISYYNDKSGYNAVFVQCDTGHIGFGWYDSQPISPRKGQTMATLLAYAFGCANAQSDDETLLTLLHNELPYDGHMNVPLSELDALIYSSMQPPRRDRHEHCFVGC